MGKKKTPLNLYHLFLKDIILLLHVRMFISSVPMVPEAKYQWSNDLTSCRNGLCLFSWWREEYSFVWGSFLYEWSPDLKRFFKALKGMKEWVGNFKSNLLQRCALLSFFLKKEGLKLYCLALHHSNIITPFSLLRIISQFEKCHGWGKYLGRHF